MTYIIVSHSTKLSGTPLPQHHSLWGDPQMESKWPLKCTRFLTIKIQNRTYGRIYSGLSNTDRIHIGVHILLASSAVVELKI